jgi:hypothetical protein
MEKYPEESDEKIGRRCQQEIRNDPALQRAIYEDIYRDLFQELREPTFGSANARHERFSTRRPRIHSTAAEKKSLAVLGCVYRG